MVLRIPSLHRASALGFLLSVAMPLSVTIASAQSFSDVSESHPAFAAVEFLKQQNILQGYADGTFKPNQAVARAEAVKILVATKMEESVLPAATTSYTDVPADAWYGRWVEAARTKLGIIDGPPSTTVFKGGNPVKLVEFLKMLFIAQEIDTSAFGEIKLPLANDVTNPEEWYYPHLRYALSASMILIDEAGNLHPAKELTRGDVAILLHRYAMYQAGRRTQALLSEEESELVNLLQMIEQGQIEQAEYASARALIAARGAHASKPDTPIVKAALKTAEAFRSLVRAYRAGQNNDLDETLRLSKEAWAQAEAAKQISPDLNELAGSLQQIATTMANQARGLQTPQQ